MDRHGIAQVIDLQRMFGLRANEAICARADTLQRWQREVQAGGKISVTAGTKGGRDRDVRVLDRGAALDVLRAAHAVAQRQAGFLIVR